MRIETDNLIIRRYEIKDENDVCEYMLQRVKEEFEAYPDFSIDKSKSEIKFRISSDEFYAIELKKKVKLLVIFI